MQQSSQDSAEQRDESRVEDPIVEVITPDVYNPADGSSNPFSRIWSRKLRVKITGKDVFEKLDVRFPVSHLASITNIQSYLSVYSFV